MAILFTEVLPREEKLFRESLLPVHTIYFSRASLSEISLKEYDNITCVCIGLQSTITQSILEQLPQLKLIVTRTTGFDHLDLNMLRKTNIVACNIPSYAAISVAEQVFALILALSRRITECAKRVKEGSFSCENLEGFELYRKTLGIIGTGKIGKQVITLAAGFNISILAYDLRVDPECEQKSYARYVSLPELYSQSDIISLHLPLTKDTFHMCNEKIFSQLKKGVYIINTARGALIDTHALIKALQDNIIAGCGLDVLEKKYHFDKYLLSHSRVIITPHNAFNTHEAHKRLVYATINTINAWYAGTPINVIQ